MQHHGVRGARQAGTWLSLLCLGACATTQAEVQATIQPRYAVASRLTRVAVLGFDGQVGSDFGARLEAALSAAEDKGGKVFTMVERDTLLAAGSASARRGGPGLTQAVLLGRRAGVQGVYFGTVAASVSHGQSQQQRHVCNQYEQTKNLFKRCVSSSDVKVDCATTTANVTAVPKLVDVATGVVVYSRTVGRSWSAEACSDQPGLPDDGAMLGAAMSGVIVEIAHDVAPWSTTLKVDLKTAAPDLPKADQVVFQNAAAFAHAGRIDRACGSYDALYDRYPTSVAVIYNRGVCAETSGDFGKALRYYADADARLTRPDASINTALKRCRALMAGQAPS